MDYELHLTDREQTLSIKKGGGGGVCVFVKNGIEHERITTPKLLAEVCIVLVTKPTKFVIMNVYFPPVKTGRVKMIGELNALISRCRKTYDCNFVIRDLLLTQLQNIHETHFVRPEFWNEYRDKFSVEEERHALNQVKSNKGPGPMEISAAFLKSLPTKMEYQLAALMNQIMKIGTFPSEWNESFMVPIPKSADKADTTK